MIIAIDHGNSAIKTPDLTFTSGVAMHTECPPAVGDILSYGGKYYTLSEQRIPYLRDKSSDERYYVLTLFAVARTLQRSGCISGSCHRHCGGFAPAAL